ncbi:unnamed protein product [Ceratitis capitata]|uniref:(Mediterranean fruit fly) hypothetical protein n=1 Tax=Ceratitis capitata TaxID=7213 RepID=A0A811UCN8_CERCA|nr:unnamed protein product [Ceratitis capitata]
MNDIRMGFKHTMLQRLQNYEVYPSTKSTPSSNASESGDEQTSQPASQVTDFSISRILGVESQQKNTTKVPTISVKTNLAAVVPGTTTPPATSISTDILDLSKSSPTTPEHKSPVPILMRQQPAYPTPTYQPFHPDFLAAAAAANATKFYAQFFPHMFAPYTLPAFNVPPSTATTYQKQRYFAPYILNPPPGASTAPTSCANPRLTSTLSHQPHPTHAPHSPAAAKTLCPRAASCTDCFDFYKQYPAYAKSPLPSVPSSPASSTSSACHSSFSTNYFKTKSSAEINPTTLLKSSSIALTTIANFNLTTKTTKLCTSSPTSVATLNAEEVSYKCCICDKVFGCSQTLQAHEKTHKSPRYECTDCGKGFSQLRNYKYHLSVHRGTKEFAAECPECGKTFNDKGYLSSHMKIHRNKKEYECPYCPKSFNQRVAFNMHVRIHTGVKPHKCAECGKRFSRKMLLKQHMRTHSGEKPYQCSVCGKSFADRSNMTLHHRLHSGIKPFNCPIVRKHSPRSITSKPISTIIPAASRTSARIPIAIRHSHNPATCVHMPRNVNIDHCNYPIRSRQQRAVHQMRFHQQHHPHDITHCRDIINTNCVTSRHANCAASEWHWNECKCGTQFSGVDDDKQHNGIVTHSNLSTALSAGMRMLSAASTAAAAAGAVTLPSGTTSGGHNVAAQQSLLPFPPAQQPLMGTLRPF